MAVAVSLLLYALTGPLTHNGTDFVAGDRVLVDAATAAWLDARLLGGVVINPTKLQIAEAQHLALARKRSCCFGR